MSDQKRLIGNFSAMGFLQIMNNALPFVTLPYLVRVLNPEGYGVFLFSQAFIAYFIMFTDFGFELSATREVSLNRNDKMKLSEIVSSVLIIKFTLAVVSFVILMSALLFVPSLREYWQIHILTFLMVFGNILLSFFFYQGIEKMKFIAFINAGVKLFFTILIFIMVKNNDDLYLVPTINSIGYIIAGMISIYLIKRMGIELQIPKRETLIQHFRNSLQFFWSRVSVSLYTTSNTFVIGLILGPTAAGIFGAAEKLLNGLSSLYGPLSSVLYPYLTYSKNIQLYKKFLYSIVVLNTLMSIILFWQSELIIKIIFGPNYIDSVYILKIMSLAVIFVVPGIMMGYPLFSAFNKTSFVNKTVIYPSIMHILILLIIIPVITIDKIAWLLVFTHVTVFLGRAIGAYRYKLLK
ncbi:flippase [Bacillus sp. FJAT-50079]|uniref:flippase n=1 Tax=Bacillus sp. FJAT-50079 TaxID=2833577 RepID=UPI001BCA1773|nr:flippase [Bacillus sp. FJAT-50079]MBS4206713.1 flippase [Bacillus sp. FJAT-50079]